MRGKTQVSLLVEGRISARHKRRLTYDCMNAIVNQDRVLCKKGHEFPQTTKGQYRGLDLVSVLTGRSSRICQDCKDYDGEVTE